MFLLASDIPYEEENRVEHSVENAVFLDKNMYFLRPPQFDCYSTESESLFVEQKRKSEGKTRLPSSPSIRRVEGGLQSERLLYYLMRSRTSLVNSPVFVSCLFFFSCSCSSYSSCSSCSSCSCRLEKSRNILGSVKTIDFCLTLLL